MQRDERQEEHPVHIRPTRLIKHSHHFLSKEQWSKYGQPGLQDVATQPTASLNRQETEPSWHAIHRAPTSVYDIDASIPDQLLDISSVSTMHLMRLSGMMRAINLQQLQHQSSDPGTRLIVPPDGYPPKSTQQTGPLPIANIYEQKPFGGILPSLPLAEAIPSVQAEPRPRWKTLLNSPVLKIIFGLIVGIAMLYLVTRLVNIPTTVDILKKNLTTPRGITLALLSGVAFLGAFSLRGIRWKLFLNSVGKVSTARAIQLFLVGIFLNFLLPVRGGEVAKSLMLKRISDIPVSHSLPTVAMDKALDLLPALFIMVLVPLLGVKMSLQLWLILAAVGSLLIGLLFFIALAAWKRAAAISLLQKFTGMLPGTIGDKIAGFAAGFVDSLLAGASQPQIFIPAVLLTILAVIGDGLYAMLAFWTIGFPISFGQAMFGYTVYNMFYILPTPPGQVGSNEITGLLVFHGLLGLDAHSVTAMFLFSHPWAALLMCSTGMLCLSALGLTISSAMKVQTTSNSAESPQPESTQLVGARTAQ